MSTIKCQGHFRIFQIPLAMHLQKNCQRLSKNLCILPQQWLRHTLVFAKCYDLVFLQLSLLVLPKLQFLLMTHLMGETEKNISLADNTVLISSCVLVILGVHLIQRQKNLMVKIQQHVKTKVSNPNQVIPENQLKCCF